MLRNIPVTQIVPGNNDRKAFEPTALRQLADSIAKNGLAQPVVVRKVESETYQVCAGERRFRAMSELLGWEKIPCLVRTFDDEQASSIMLLENIARINLNPIEEAQAYQTRQAEFGWSIEQVAEVAGTSKETVKKRLALLTLVPEIQQLVATGNLPIAHAECCAKLDSNRQHSALRILQAAKTPLTAAQFRSICQQLHDEQQQDTLLKLEDIWKADLAEGKALPTRGKRAVTGAPTLANFPQIAFDIHKDTIGDVFDRTISTLLTNGQETEAAALGSLYTFLVHNHRVTVPARAALLQA